MIPETLLASKRITRRLGWRPDLPDHRDLRLSSVAPVAVSLPDRTSNYKGHAAIGIYDQYDLGSCTANAVLRAYRIAIRRTVGGLHDFDGSRLAHYYWTRVLEGSESWDSGASIRDAMKVLTKVGIAAEKAWPYTTSRFADEPPASVVGLAAKRLRVEYRSVDQTSIGIKSALVARHPVVFGMSVFESTMIGLEDAGMVPVPGPSEAVLGGHALLIEDFDDVTFAEPVYLVANSWGVDVGLGASDARPLMDRLRAAGYDVSHLPGYAIFPQRVLHDTNIADDFWCVLAAA